MKLKKSLFNSFSIDCFKFGNDVNRCISFGRASVLITVTFPSNVSFLCCQLFNIFPKIQIWHGIEI